MVAKFYFHDAATSVTGTLPATGSSQWAGIPNVFATGAGTNRSMTATAGTAQIAPTLASVAQTAFQDNFFRRFVSPPLAAQTIDAAMTFTLALGGLTSNATNSAFIFSTQLYLWRPSSGANLATLFDVGGTTAENTAAAAVETGYVRALNGIQSGAVTLLDGDVVICEIHGTATQGMSTSYTWTFDYDGTVDPVNSTAISSAASYIQFSLDLPLYVASSVIARPPTIMRQAVKRASLW